MQFKGTLPERPDNISLKAILAWEYFFEDKPGTWAVVRTYDGAWIITDETMELEVAQVLPDDESFVEWLEDVADDHLKNMPDEFLGLFITAPELLMDETFRLLNLILSMILILQAATMSLVFTGSQTNIDRKSVV